MRLVCAIIMSIVALVTEANAQVIQENFLGDNVNVIQQNIVRRPVVKKTRVVGRKVVNNYTIIENNTTVAPAPAPVPVPVPAPVVPVPRYYSVPVPYYYPAPVTPVYPYYPY